MTMIANFFKDILASITQTEQQRREAYLANAADIHDLEFRLKEIDRVVLHIS